MGQNSVEGFVAVPGGSASDEEGGNYLYGGEAVSPDDNIQCLFQVLARWLQASLAAVSPARKTLQ